MSVHHNPSQIVQLLYWFPGIEDQMPLPTFSAMRVLSDTGDVDLQGILERFLSYEEAEGVAQYLQSIGHEAIVIHPVNSPMSAQDLANLLWPDGNLYAVPIQGTGASAYLAYTLDQL